MKLIVGLGNPGKKYEHTRHNAGFLALEFYLKNKEAISCSSKFNGQICEMHFTAHQKNTMPVKCFFIKPQSYMNSSGEVIKEIVQFYKVDFKKDLLIIHDEIDLKFGFLKLAFDSRDAGHNGVKNIIERLGSSEFHRIRIGVESRSSRSESPTDKYVLSEFTAKELTTLENEVFPSVAEEIEEFINPK